jgi:sigma-B regulation protein RsbU (phosphoserine phosphatase)
VPDDFQKGFPVAQSGEENRRLRRAVEELSILNDLARAIGASLNSQEIMHTIIHRSLRAMDAEQGVITMVDQHAAEPMKTLIRTMVSSAAHSPYHFNQSLLGWMQLNRRPIVVNDPLGDERFRGVQWEESVHSLLSVPLMIKSELRGVLTVYNKREGRPFTEEDQRLLAIIAAQSAQVIENARLYESEKTLLRMNEELRMAAKIQEDLLPKSAPQVPGYDIAGKTVPAQVVGGDYFDFIAKEETKLAICLGDVSGKGLAAALLMANLQATLRGQTLTNSSARVCVQQSNRLLYQSTSPEKFATLFYGLLDGVRHTLTYSNAGHEIPILLSAENQLRQLETGGTVLSIVEDFPFEEETIPIAVGDLLVIYSDGITEAMNECQEQFGPARLERVIKEMRREPAAGLMEQIVSAVRSHTRGVQQADDMTLVVVKRTH